MKFIYFFAALCIAVSASAQTPTWSTDVAKIMYTNCTSCHHSGGIAPFSLIEYSNAYQRKSLIANEVGAKRMPPFPADVTYRTYAHQRALSEADIATIISWVYADAPEGDISKAPTPPTYTGGDVIKSPDLSVKMPVYTSTAFGKDEYRAFVMPANLTEDKNITGIEIVPGNPEIVHHVLVFSDTSIIPVNLDAKDPEPGYSSFGGVGSMTAQLLGGYVPGSAPFKFPEGFGLKLPKGSRIIIQIHYPKGASGHTDQTKVNFEFAKGGGVIRPVYLDPILNEENITNGSLVIPANTKKTFTQLFDGITIDVSLMAVLPHMHLIGKSTKIWATPPVGEVIPIVKIDNWDFHWQMNYTFEKLVKIPKASLLESEVTYDNTTDNPNNPNSPPKIVRWGEKTTDEMCLTYFYYTFYLPGDENIDMTKVAFPVSVRPDVQVRDGYLYPNPAASFVNIKADNGASYSLKDALGREVSHGIITNGRVDVTNVADGMYYVAIGNTIEKLIVKK
jgi:cytochrome c553